MKSRKPARVGLKDLAREVGVHVSTVSRALNPDSDHPVAPGLVAEIRKASSTSWTASERRVSSV